MRASLRSDDEKCDKCAQKRNAMVHSYWTPKEDGSGLRLRIKRSNVGQPFETERITITPEELEADITFFKTTQNELGDFLFEIVSGIRILNSRFMIYASGLGRADREK